MRSNAYCGNLLWQSNLTLQAPKNGCYVGSDGGGISKIENDKIVKNIGKKDGLSSNVILRMVYDPSNKFPARGKTAELRILAPW